MRIALAIEYDGSRFSGWQIQALVPTIQASLELAIGKMAHHPVRIHAAGRTDAGVHASRQIVHFDTHVIRPLTAWVTGVNNYLPKSISVLWAKEVDSSFHARFSAIARHYRYVLCSHPVRPTLLAGKVGWVYYPLDISAMQLAAIDLLGEHDFSSFRAAECQAKTPIKILHKLCIEQREGLVMCDFSANAFLHHMVRNIMGLLLQIGRQKMPVNWAQTVLECRTRTKAPPTFMPDGLYLTGVSYPNEFGLESEPKHRYGPW